MSEDTATDTETTERERSCPAPAGSELPLDHPKVIEWRKNTKSAAKAHNLANDALVKVAQENPRRPWHKKRMADACARWEETLEAIPPPPTESGRGEDTMPPNSEPTTRDFHFQNCN